MKDSHRKTLVEEFEICWEECDMVSMDERTGRRDVLIIKVRMRRYGL